MRKIQRQHEKEPYQGLRLVTYGALREITRAVGSKKMLDGGATKATKRSGIAT